MNIAIVGATGLVGRKIIKLCEEFFDNSVEFQLFASKTSEGKILSVNDIDAVSYTHLTLPTKRIV